MLKSVWLPNLIVSSMNEAGSVLATYYSHLTSLVGTDKGSMIPVSYTHLTLPTNREV